MAMMNAKSIRNALATFFKEHGREPDFNEFRQLITGQKVELSETQNAESEKVS